jgi:hypothetical protein
MTKEQIQQIEEGNRLIAAFMEVAPEIEYCVGSKEKDSICYSPKLCYFDTPYRQEIECERFLREQATKYPNGWVTKEGYTTIKFEWFPRYDKDWNALIPACHKWDNLNEFLGNPEYEQRCDELDRMASLYEIEPLWTVLVENIKWLNQQTQNNG